MTSRFRYGAHMYLFSDRWSDAQLTLLDRARDLGLDHFEVSLGDDVQFTPALLCRRAQELDLEITIGPGGEWPIECDISDDDASNRAGGLQWHRRMIGLAAESGAVAYCGALYGHPGKVLRRVPPAHEPSRTAENLQILAEYAARAGVTLAIEPMSRFRTHLVNTASQAAALLAAADHANLRIILDTFHLVTETRDYGAEIRAAGCRLWGIHACENDRGVPGGGLVPWGEVFGALLADCPDARVVMETYNTAIPGFAPSRGVFQDLCPDGAEFVRRGLAFLRGQERIASASLAASENKSLDSRHSKVIE